MWEQDIPATSVELLRTIIIRHMGREDIDRYLVLACDTLKAAVNSYYVPGLAFILTGKDITRPQEASIESYLSLGLNLRFHSVFCCGKSSMKRAISINKSYVMKAREMYEHVKMQCSDQQLYFQMKQELDSWPNINIIVGTALLTLNDNPIVRDDAGFPSCAFGTMEMPLDYFSGSDVPVGLLIEEKERYMAFPTSPENSETSLSESRYFFLSELSTLITEPGRLSAAAEMMEKFLPYHGIAYQRLAFKLRQRTMMDAPGSEDPELLMTALGYGLDRLVELDNRLDYSNEEVYRNADLRQNLIRGIGNILGKLQCDGFRWGFDITSFDEVEYFCSIYQECIQTMMQD